MSDAPPTAAPLPPIPSAAVIQDALDLLEPWSGEPGSLELHDAVYALSEGEAAWAGLLGALVRWPAHPAAGALREVLDLVEPPQLRPTLAAVLARHGPGPVGLDPVEEVDRRLARAAEVRGILDARVEQLEGELGVARRVGNGVAFAGALAAVAGLLGWAAALGLWEIDWLDAPADESPSAMADDPPAP